MQFFTTQLHTKLLVLLSVIALGLVAQIVLAQSAFNEEINYQGKLTDATGATVSDGNYPMTFRLYTVPTGGSAIWIENSTSTITSGLFSIMLGSSSSFANIDFNQTLYLGVEIDGDGEMTPRKVLGAVPAAFESRALGGATSTQYLRSDTADQMDAFLTLTAGASSTNLIVSDTATTSNLFVSDVLTSTGSLTLSNLNNGGFLTTNSSGVVSTSTVSAGDLTEEDFGSFTVAAGVATIDTDAITPDMVQSGSQVDEYCLTYESGDTWEWQDCSAGSFNLGGLGDVNTTGVASGDILVFNGSFWEDMSTSTFLMEAELNTEAELESLLGDVTDVFTNNDTQVSLLGQSISLANEVVGTLDIASTSLSVSATGLTFSGGDIGLDGAYNIPLIASTTNWNTFYNTPSARITDGTGLTWSGNTLNLDNDFGASIDESELNIVAAPVNGYVLQASSTSAGGFVWVATSTLGINGTADDLSDNVLAELSDVGASNVTGSLLYFDGVDWDDIATSSLNINTDNLVEGSNQFFTNARVASYINGSSTIWNATTEASLETFLSDVTNILTNNDTIAASQLGLAQGNILVGDVGGNAAATSSLFVSSDGSVGIGTTTYSGTGSLVIQTPSINTPGLRILDPDGSTALRFVPNSTDQQSKLSLYPGIDDGGFSIAFYAQTPESSSTPDLPLDIKVHGVNDFYDPGDRDVSFYTWDADGNNPKAFEWKWGAGYEGQVTLPTMGLRIDRIYNTNTGTTTTPYGLYINEPTLNANAEIATNYGLFIEDQTVGSTDNFTLYSEDGKNYFGGAVGIGNTDPLAKLSVLVSSSSPVDLQHWRNSNDGVDLVLHQDNSGYGFYSELGGEAGSGNLSLFLNNSGNIGIGTSTPTRQLTIDGAAYFTDVIRDNTDSAGTNGQILQTTGSGISWVSTSSLGFSSQSLSLGTDNQVPFTNSGGTDFDYDADLTFDGSLLTVGGTGISLSGSTANLTLGSNYLSGDGGDEGVTVGTDGRVNTIFGGAGTESVMLALTTSDSRELQLLQPDTADNNDAFTWSTFNAFSWRVDGNDILNIDSGGDVGIGTTSPATLLDVWGDFQVGTSGTPVIAVDTGSNLTRINGGLGINTDATSGGLYFNRDGNDPFILFQENGSGIGQIRADATNDTIRFTALSGTVDYLTVDVAGTNVGNVGIGSSSPGSRLSVEGNTFLGGNLTATGSLIFGGNTLSTLTGDGLTASGTELTLDINGQTTESAFGSGDFITFYDTSAGGLRKLDYDNLPGAGGGLTSLNGLTASTQNFATTSDTNLGLNIVSSGSTHTFTPTWSGQLGVTRGGTGLSTVTTGDLLYGSGADTIAALGVGGTGSVLTVSGGIPTWSATSSLGLGDGTLGGLTDVDLTNVASGDLIRYNGSSWATTSVSDLGVLTFGTDNQIPFTNSGGTDYDYSSNLTFDGSTLLVQTTGTADILNLLETGGSEVFTVLENGNVGIGSTSPDAQLVVTGPSSDNTGGIKIGSIGGQPARLAIFADGSNSTQFQKLVSNGYLSFTNSSGDNEFVLTNGGKAEFANNMDVGSIITTSDRQFNVFAPDTAVVARFESSHSGNNATIQYSNPLSTGSAIRAGSVGTRFAVFTDSTERFSFDKDGLLGIGDTAPDFGLELVTATTSGYFAISSSAGADGDILVVDENSNVGIGTTTPTSRLSVGGDTFLGGSLTLSNLNNGGFLTTNSSGVVSTSTVSAGDLTEEDFGSFTVAAGVATIDTDAITPDMVQSGSQVDEYCLTYESGDTWEWQDCSAGSFNLGGLGDVNTTGVASGDILVFNGSFWEDMSTSTFLMEAELNTEAELESLLGDVTDVFTNNDGALDDDDISNDSLETLNDVASFSQSAGDVLYWTGAEWNVTATTSWDTDTILSEEEVEDFVGGMLGGTETGISVTYQDSTNDIDFVVDNVTAAMLNNEDFGDFSCNGTTCSFDSNTVSDNEIDYTTVTLADFTNDAALLASSSLNTEAKLEALLSDVSNVFTNNDSIGDANVADTITIDGGSVADNSLSANVSLLGQSISLATEVVGTLDIGSTTLTAGNGATLTGDTLTVTAAGGLAQTTGGLTTTGVLEDLNTLGAAASDGQFIVATGAGTFAYESGATARSSLGVDVAGTDNSTPVTLTGEDYLSLSTQEITANAINPDNLANTDFGDFSCNGTTCSFDSNTVSDNEIDYTTVTLADFTNDAALLASSSLNTEAKLEALLSDVSNVFTNNDSIGDGNIADDITLTNITQITNRAISDTTGTLTAGRGGTGATTLTDGGILLGSGTGAVTATAVLGNGELLIGDGTTDPTIATITGGTGITITNGAGSITTSFDCSEVEGVGIDCSGESITLDATGGWTGTIDGNNFVDGAVTTGDLLYGSGAGSISELSIGSTGQVLMVSGGLPSWVATSSLGFSSQTLNLGTDNQIPYTNSGGTDFDYSSNFTFDGTDVTVGSGGRVLIGSRTMLQLGSNSDSYFLGGSNPSSQGSTDNNNIGIGLSALTALTNGNADNNIALGISALNSLTGADQNVAIGNSALSDADSSSNVAIGYNAGNGLSNFGGGSNVFIGAESDIEDDGASAVIIGSGASGNASSVVLGSSITNAGSNSIVIGASANALGSDIAETLNIGNLIFGTGLGTGGTSVSSGSIGLGTTSPASLLDVYGDFRVGTSSTPLIFADASDTYVGIGTASPGRQLHLYGDADIRFENLLGHQAEINLLNASGDFTISNNVDTEINGIYIQRDGDVGIWTAAPQAKLDVRASSSGAVDVQHWRNEANGLDLFLNQDDGGYGFYSEVGQTGNLSLFVAGGGNVGVGTTTTPRQLTVDGDANITGALYDSSDSAGTNGQILQTTGSGISWVSTSSLGFSSQSLSLGTDNQVPFTNSGGTDFDYDADLTFDGSLLTVGGTGISLSGSTANLTLGSNYLSGDGGDEGVTVGTDGRVNTIFGGAGTESVMLALTTSDSRELQLLQPDTADNNDAFTWSTFNAFSWRVDGNDILNIDSGGDVGIGTTSPNALFSVENKAFTGAGVIGTDQFYESTNSTENAVQFGNRGFIDMNNTATTTMVGSIYRVADDTTLGNTVRGLEVQANRGGNTQGENTALSGFARTFGVRGFSSGDAGGSFEPAGGFFETGGTTQGNALRGYSSTITSAELLSLFQEDSAFTGTGLLMNFGNDTGSFDSATSKFVDFQNAGASMFTVEAYGTTTIGDGTTAQQAGLQIGYGGLCVDNDGSCSASTTGRITAVEYDTSNSDLAEMYFSSENLLPGELVVTDEFLSVERATQDTKERILGVVSTKPGLTMGADDTSLIPGQTGHPIALSGRVPVRLSTENGTIEPGDPVTLSSIPGIAMKATQADIVVGYALESFDGRNAYTEGFVNQFGDDIAEPNFEAINVNEEANRTNGCYFGGGTAAGEGVEECDPNDVIEEIVQSGPTEEDIAAAQYEAQQEALEDLLDEPADTDYVNGVRVKVGQIIMFVDRGYYQLASQTNILNELSSTSPDLVLGQASSDETLWDRLKVLAQGFVEGVLTITGLKTELVESDRIETGELCVDGVCVTADDLRALLEASNNEGQVIEVVTGPTETQDETEEETTAEQSEGATSTDSSTEVADTQTSSSTDTETSTTTELVIEEETETASSTREAEVSSETEVAPELAEPTEEAEEPPTEETETDAPEVEVEEPAPELVPESLPEPELAPEVTSEPPTEPDPAAE